MATKKSSSKGRSAASKKGQSAAKKSGSGSAGRISSKGGSGSKGGSKKSVKASKKGGGASKGGASKKVGAKKGVNLGAAVTWLGAPLTLTPNQVANMANTAGGMMIFAYQNTSTMNNAGKLSLSSGSGGQLLPAPALTNQPQLLANNWGGNNLSVNNISTTPNTPIWIAAAGPGLPGVTPIPLVIGTPLTLSSFQAAQGNAPARSVVVTLQSTSSPAQLTILVIQVGNDVMAIALNAAQEAGPGTNNPSTAPPAGYYATTTGNTYQNMWNWGANAIFVVNMSPSTAAIGSVSVT